MKIRLQATEWTLGNGVTFNEFFEKLKAWSTMDDASVREFTFKGKQRLLVVEKVGDFWLMIMLSERGHRRTFEMERDDKGRITIHARDVEEGKQPIDFNYYLCHHETGRGVYAHYHLSCGFDDTTKLSKKVYLDWRDELIEKETKATGGSERARHKATKKYSGWLKGILLVTPKEIRSLVEELRLIRLLELTFGEVQVDKDWGQPLEGTVTVAKHVFTFSKDIPIRKLRDKVIQAIERSKIKRGKVAGETRDGIATVYKLSKNAGTFEELDFDKVASDLTIDLAKPSDSTVVKRMQAAINKRPGYFIRPKKADLTKKSDSEKKAKKGA